MRWVPITALLLAVAWRPSANYQILLHFVVCAGAIMMILALVFIKQNRDPQYRQIANHFRLSAQS
jgi:uncharacterized integral membrane protein